MANFFDTRRFSAFTTPRTIHLCLVVAVIGPMCRETATEPNATSVTPIFTLSDCPLWVDSDHSVYFIDAIQDQLNRYNSGTTNSVTLSITDQLRFLVHVSNQSAFAIGYSSTVGVFPWDGKSKETLSPTKSLSLTDDPNIYIECGKADPEGLLWIGASFLGDTSKGRFYSVDSAGTVKLKLDINSQPGGITWDLAYEKIFYSDKIKKTIVKCSFNLNDGIISNDGTVFFDFAANQIVGSPNGITTDSSGNLWVACSNTNKVLKLDSMTGTLVTTITLPGTTSITSVEFGGSGKQNLYVTTANDQATGEGGNENAGKMFEVTDTGSDGIGSYDIVINWPA